MFIHNEKVQKMFEPVENEVHQALLAAWDGCHKIYLAMDSGQANWFRDNYEHTVEYESGAQILNTVMKWWDESCGLRFINSCHSDPNNTDTNWAIFTELIPQFFEEETDDENI